ncbi:uncharacterized protein si:dkey-21c1.4 [Astyanax mexicanus]|uniref:uncharacterized protein si:dkey-21c1.4 n=1 Tax=Astyanax mexicanus TaxID=7994 RepID=UPI0020CADD29|nr:uncharacterized protein si:dkey-21c1.4 [Astyanax mexicanus]
MNLELCPFCGKPFKRLKSHLPHCKMSPGSKTKKSNTGPEELLTATSKDTTQKHHKNKASLFRENLKESSSLKPQAKSNMKAEKVSVDEDTLAKVPSAERRDTETVKPKSKWLAKREQEMMKRATRLTQKENRSTSDSQKEKDNGVISETSKGQVKGGLQIERKCAQGQNLKKPKGTFLTSQVTTTKFDMSVSELLHVPETADSQTERSRQRHNANVFDETQKSPKAQSKTLASVPRVKEDFSFFQTKTSVWDHIKHGLYDRRLDSVPALQPTGTTQEVSVHRHPTEKKQTAVTKASSPSSGDLFASSQTSVQKIPEDLFTSVLKNKRLIEPSSERVTDYGRPPHSGISSNDGLLTKHQSSRLPPENPDPGAVQRLGDVRLGELAAWLRTRTPKSPGGAVTMFHRGWQWYYRKYIDVQKGGIGGISMLIAGYCVLSYIWSYPHLKKERWRKYH